MRLLRPQGVVLLADVRSIPRSRRHPQFTAEALAAALRDEGIEYRHFPGLGGLRKPRRDSINTAWINEGFRGFADHMLTPAFEHALDELVETARTGGPVAIMCAEALWWRCHRQLIADALVARGIAVHHITSGGRIQPHALNERAVVRENLVTYPGLF